METSFTVSAAALLRPLLIASAAAGLILAVLLLRGVHLARIGVRNTWRHRTQTALIVAGLMLSTMFVASALAIDDTITLAVKTVAVFNLGRIDEDVLHDHGGGALHTYDADVGARVRDGLRGNPNVAGVAPALVVPNVLVADETARQVRGGVSALGMDAADAGTLGALRDTSGAPASPAALGAGDVYLNGSLAALLSARPGDTVALYAATWPGERHRLRVKAIVSGGPLGDAPAAVLTLPSLQSFAHAPDQINHIYVANAGDGLTGVNRSDSVADAIYGILPSYGLRVDTVKADGVQLSLRAQDVFGRILTLYTLFALAIGLLLIFLIFALLAAERRGELGIARALGMRRAHIVRMLLFEGSVYDAVAATAGILAGLGLGVLIVGLVGPTITRIGFPLKVEVQPQSLAVAFCLGLVFTLATIWLAAWTVSRMTIAAAVRDLPEPPPAPVSLPALLRDVVRPHGNGLAALGSLASGLVALVAGITTRGIVPFIAGWWLLRHGTDDADLLTFSLGLTLAVIGLALMLRWAGLALIRTIARLRAPASAAWIAARATAVADRLTCVVLGGGLALYWSLPFDALRGFGLPRFSGGIEVFFVAGVMMVFGVVWAVAPNLDLLLAPVRWLVTRIGPRRHVSQVALLYPSHHRFRTGVSVALFSLVCFTMVVMACIAASTTSGYDNLPQETSGYDVAGQPLFTPVGGVSALRADLQRAGDAGDVSAVSSATPLPLGILQPGAANARWSLYPASQIDGAFLDGVGLPLVARAQGYADDAAVWRAVRQTPGAVVIDAGALSPADASALGLPPPPAPSLQQFQGAPIASGLPGLSSLESIHAPDATALKPLRGIQLDAGTLDQVRLRLQGIAVRPSEIRPTPIWVTDARGGAAVKLTIVGIVENARGVRFGLFGSAATFGPAERGLPPFGNEYYYFTVPRGTDAHDAARAVGSALLNYGFETTVLQDLLLDVNGPRVFISRVLVGLVGLTLLVGMASLAVTGSRAVVERRQQIGMLRALGYHRAHVQGIFLIESLLVGATGTAVGLVLGLILCQNIFAVDFFEQFGTGLTLTIPWAELGVICAAALGVSLVAAALPAWQAGRVAPADALRYE